MVFNKKRTGNRTSQRQRTLPNNNSRTVNLMQLIRSHSRYHPYENHNNGPSSTSRRYQNRLRNNINDINQLNRSDNSQVSTIPSFNYTRAEEDIGTNTSATYCPEHTQPEVLSNISTATQSDNLEEENDIDRNKDEALRLQMRNVYKTLVMDKTANDKTEEQPGLSHLAPMLQTSNKSSSESTSTVSYIEEEKSLDLHIIPYNASADFSLGNDSVESSSGLFSFLLSPQTADLAQPHSSYDENGTRFSLDTIPDVGEPEHVIPLIVNDEEAGGDGDHNTSVVMIEITFTANPNSDHVDEGEGEANDET